MDAFPSYFISANNIRMHYWREGRGSTLLLLHGWPEFCRTWRRLIPLLAAGFDLIAPDFRGFGDTEKPDPGPTDAMTVDVLAEDMRALLDALGLDRPSASSRTMSAPT
jgi:pimeloyl-ACP methyl ester carboxylesterase